MRRGRPPTHGTMAATDAMAGADDIERLAADWLARRDGAGWSADDAAAHGSHPVSAEAVRP